MNRLRRGMTFFAEIREGFGISWDAIRANKMRSVLTTLGIVIGIVTVTLMGTAIEGLDRAFLNSISSLGADVFYVGQRDWIIQTQDAWLSQQKRQRMKLVDAEALAKQFDSGSRRRAHRQRRRVCDIQEPQRQRRHDHWHHRGLSAHHRHRRLGRPVPFPWRCRRRPARVRHWRRGGDQSVSQRAGCRQPDQNREPSFEVIGVLEKQGTMLGESLDDHS